MMIEDTLTPEEKEILLKLARESLEAEVQGQPLAPLNLTEFSQKLQDQGATFVTLIKNGHLRGCIGALDAYQPLAKDVREHAISAATQDYRFAPVQANELSEIRIEISRLTSPKPLEYANAEDLAAKLRPGTDGVVLKDGYRRATFLPQVWKSLPTVSSFLGQLCMKMGVSSNAWQKKKLEVLIYQVEEFHE